MSVSPEDREAATYRHLQDQRAPVRQRRNRIFWRTAGICIATLLVCLAVIAGVEHSTTLLGQGLMTVALLALLGAGGTVMWLTVWGIGRDFLDTAEDVRDGKEARRRTRGRR